MGSGTQTSTLASGGEPAKTETESWNGTNWTNVTGLNTGRYASGSAGVRGA